MAALTLRGMDIEFHARRGDTNYVPGDVTDFEANYPFVCVPQRLDMLVPGGRWDMVRVTCQVGDKRVYVKMSHKSYENILLTEGNGGW